MKKSKGVKYLKPIKLKKIRYKNAKEFVQK